MLLHNRLKDYNIILASQSPRRQELMRGADINFRTAEDFNVKEVYPENIEKKDVAEYLSKLKAEAYPYPIGQKDVVITADTTVLIGEQILGKPASEKDAIEMIKSLSEKTHKVITGVTVKTYTNCESFNTSTKVKFASLTDEEVEYYVKKYKPYDKAGSYGIQEWIGYVAIEHIEGSFYNVMGLPIHKLYKYLNTL